MGQEHGRPSELNDKNLTVPESTDDSSGTQQVEADVARSDMDCGVDTGCVASVHSVQRRMSGAMRRPPPLSVPPTGSPIASPPAGIRKLHPILKQSSFSSDIKEGVVSTPEKEPSTGPTKMKRLFRRRSSTRIFPDDGLLGDGAMSSESAASSAQTSPSPLDNSKGLAFLFSGVQCPVAVEDPGLAEEGFITVQQLYNSLNDGQLSPYRYDPLFMLIIDTRSVEDYRAQHIATARHVSDLEDARLVEPLDSYTVIVLYDHKGLSHSLTGSVLATTLEMIQSLRGDAFILAGGYDTFNDSHHYLCTDRIPVTEQQRQMLIFNYPSMVLDGVLYLGRGDQATNAHTLAHLRITHILNITKEHPCAFPDRIQYLTVEVDDENTANLLREFSSIIQFMTEAMVEDGRVLVHCNLGVSRSATVVIAYLMCTRKWTLKDTYNFVKERRPIMHPNRGFVHQLSRFEEMLFGKKFSRVEEMY